MRVKDITSWLDHFAPLSFQESYDNAGLIVGDPDLEIHSVLVTVDVTEAVIDEAIRLNSNLVVAHHPVIFAGLKSITGRTYVERIIIKAIQNHIAIYASHTNLDGILGGVSSKMAGKLGLIHTSILSPRKGELRKLVIFVPVDKVNQVRLAIFKAGAGEIGNYDLCSFNILGEGSFRGGENTKPYVGKKGELHFEKEVRVETVFPKYLQEKIITALLQAHPYEEVAYDIYPLENRYERAGMGIIGELKKEMDEIDFLKQLKVVFHAKGLRHTSLSGNKVRKIAVCGGSGSFLLNEAIKADADVYVSADFKYHQFFNAENKILIADVGHYESEQFTKEILYEALFKNFPKFAVHFSEVNTNPINYL